MTAGPESDGRPALSARARVLYATLGFVVLVGAGALFLQESLTPGELVWGLAMILVGARIVTGAVMGHVPGWLAAFLTSPPV